jgi:hypothetical protein
LFGILRAENAQTSKNLLLLLKSNESEVINRFDKT